MCIIKYTRCAPVTSGALPGCTSSRDPHLFSTRAKFLCCAAAMSARFLLCTPSHGPPSAQPRPRLVYPAQPRPRPAWWTPPRSGRVLPGHSGLGRRRRHEEIMFLTAGSPPIASAFPLPLCRCSSNWFGADGAMMEILCIALLLSVFLSKIDRYALWSIDDAYNSLGCGACSLLAWHYCYGWLGTCGVHPLENVAFLYRFILFLCSQLHGSIRLVANCLLKGVLLSVIVFFKKQERKASRYLTANA
jgi:hypothetical protein